MLHLSNLRVLLTIPSGFSHTANSLKASKLASKMSLKLKPHFDLSGNKAYITRDSTTY